MPDYLKLILTTTIIVIVLGLAGPWLLSAKSDGSAAIGFFFLATLFPGAIYLIWRREIRSLTHQPTHQG
jgi:hypothetical protein